MRHITLALVALTLTWVPLFAEPINEKKSLPSCYKYREALITLVRRLEQMSKKAEGLRDDDGQHTSNKFDLKITAIEQIFA